MWWNVAHRFCEGFLVGAPDHLTVLIDPRGDTAVSAGQCPQIPKVSPGVEDRMGLITGFVKMTYAYDLTAIIDGRGRSHLSACRCKDLLFSSPPQAGMTPLQGHYAAHDLAPIVNAIRRIGKSIGSVEPSHLAVLPDKGMQGTADP